MSRFARFFNLPHLPYDFAQAVPKDGVVSLLGVFSRGSFFFLCWFWFWSCVRSFSSCCWFGVEGWLLFLVFASFFSFVFWVCGLGVVRVSFLCGCLCFVLFSFGWFFCGGSSWCLFGVWVCVGCFCSCWSLSCFCWGFVPLSWSAFPCGKVRSWGFPP